MKEQLEQLYGEYMQLKEQASDYFLKNLYTQKMNAIETILAPMPYNAKNPVLSTKEPEGGKCQCKTATFTRTVNENFEPLCGKCWKEI